VRVVHICSGHRIDDPRVFQKECVSLAMAGYEVHLIGIGDQTGDSVVKGVHLHPLPKCSTRKERVARRRQVAQLAASLDMDLFHVHEPELLAAVLKVAGTKPVVYDVHEPYLEAIKDRAWIPKPLRSSVAALFDRVESSLVKRCAAVVVATQYLAPRYIALGQKTITLANYPRLSEFENLPIHERPAGSCVFIGSISRVRGIVEAIEAVRRLNSSGVPVTLDIAGPFAESVVKSEVLAGASADGPIRYHGQLLPKEAVELANKCAIGLVPHWRTPHNEKAWPVKMMEYMALGLPAIYTGLETHIELAHEKEIGVCIDDPKNPDCIADAIRAMVENPVEARKRGQAGREIVKTTLNWEVESVKLIDEYKRIGPN